MTTGFGFLELKTRRLLQKKAGPLPTKGLLWVAQLLVGIQSAMNIQIIKHIEGGA